MAWIYFTLIIFNMMRFKCAAGKGSIKLPNALSFDLYRLAVFFRGLPFIWNMCVSISQHVSFTRHSKRRESVLTWFFLPPDARLPKKLNIPVHDYARLKAHGFFYACFAIHANHEQWAILCSFKLIIYGFS